MFPSQIADVVMTQFTTQITDKLCWYQVHNGAPKYVFKTNTYGGYSYFVTLMILESQTPKAKPLFSIQMCHKIKQHTTQSFNIKTGPHGPKKEGGIHHTFSKKFGGGGGWDGQVSLGCYEPLWWVLGQGLSFCHLRGGYIIMHLLYHFEAFKYNKQLEYLKITMQYTYSGLNIFNPPLQRRQLLVESGQTGSTRHVWGWWTEFRMIQSKYFTVWGVTCRCYQLQRHFTQQKQATPL